MKKTKATITVNCQKCAWACCASATSSGNLASNSCSVSFEEAEEIEKDEEIEEGDMEGGDKDE